MGAGRVVRPSAHSRVPITADVRTGVLFRVDVPDLLKEGEVKRVGFTRYFGLSAIYSITPVSEEIVKQLLPSIDGTPGEARALSSRSYRQDEDEY